MTDRRPTTRFAQCAQAYNAHRPGYPDRVFDVLLEGLGDPRALTVADVGAGTGISTRLLARRVQCVIALEPNAPMRAQAEALPNVRWLDGTAERTELASKSVDLAAAFQAFHWFEPQAAFDEFERVARRRIALVQYERDENGAFSRAYAERIRPFMLDDTEVLRLRTLDRFAAMAGHRLARAVVPATQRLTLAGLLGRAASASYLPHEGERAESLRVRLRELFEEFAQGGEVEMSMSVFVLAVDVRS